MFQEPEEKIKSCAQLYFVLSLITLIVLLFILLGDGQILVAILVGVVGTVGVYFTALIYVAFGDLVSETRENQQTNKEILKALQQCLQERETDGNHSASDWGEAASGEPDETFKVDPAGNMVVCPKCKMVQRADRGRCFQCGAYFEKPSDSEGVGSAEPEN